MTAGIFSGLRRLFCLIVCTVSWTLSVSAQEVTRTQCKQWDDTYLSLLNLFALLGVILPILFNLTLPPAFARYSWILTAPRLRIFLGALSVYLILSILFVVLPLVVGFGWFIFSGIDPAYVDCATIKFGASGIVFGLVGEGTPGVAQWSTILVLLFSACLLGAVIAHIISNFLIARIGIHSLVRGGNR